MKKRRRSFQKLCATGCSGEDLLRKTKLGLLKKAKVIHRSRRNTGYLTQEEYEGRVKRARYLVSKITIVETCFDGIRLPMNEALGAYIDSLYVYV